MVLGFVTTIALLVETTAASIATKTIVTATAATVTIIVTKATVTITITTGSVAANGTLITVIAASYRRISRTDWFCCIYWCPVISTILWVWCYPVIAS